MRTLPALSATMGTKKAERQGLCGLQHSPRALPLPLPLWVLAFLSLTQQHF